jgi:hypothetical protein
VPRPTPADNRASDLEPSNPRTPGTHGLRKLQAVDIYQFNPHVLPTMRSKQLIALAFAATAASPGLASTEKSRPRGVGPECKRFGS